MVKFSLVFEKLQFEMFTEFFEKIRRPHLVSFSIPVVCHSPKKFVCFLKQHLRYVKAQAKFADVRKDEQLEYDLEMTQPTWEI